MRPIHKPSQGMKLPEKTEWPIYTADLIGSGINRLSHKQDWYTPAIG